MRRKTKITLYRGFGMRVQMPMIGRPFAEIFNPEGDYLDDTKQADDPQGVLRVARRWIDQYLDERRGGNSLEKIYRRRIALSGMI